MAVQFMETLRRRRAVVLATGALAGATLAVAGCGGSSETGSQAGDVASYVPANSPFYLEVTTDFEGPQWTQIDDLAKLFPAYPEFRKELEKDLQGQDVNFERDVKPLLGDRAAVAVLNIPDTKGIQGSITSTDPESAAAGAAAGAADDTQVIGVVDIAQGKEDALTALLVRGGATKAGEHDGVAYYQEPGNDTVTAVADGALVVANSTGQLYKALDAHQAGGDQTLAGQSKFTDALAKLPADVFGQAYIDVGSLIRQAGTDTPQLQQLGLGDYQNAVVAASLAAEPEGARVKGVVMGAPDTGASSFTPTLDDRAPADAIAYLGFDNLAGSVSTILQQVRASQGEDVQKQIDAFAGQLPQLLGVTTDDLAALTSGEHAIVVTGGRKPGAALALTVDDGAQAQATLDKLRVGVPALLKTFSPDTQLPAWQQVPLAAGVQGWRLPLSPEAGVVYGVDGDLAIVGTNVPAVTAVQRPASPLSASAAYQAGVSGMPDQVTSVLWLNAQELISTADTFGAFDQADAKTLANLKPVKSLAAWTTGGDTPTFEVFLRLAR
ncbi:MAG: DUF3352 domain-containing protein [Thermoleophilia bacterium]